MAAKTQRSAVLPRLSKGRFEITDTALRTHVKRLTVAGIPPAEQAEMLGQPEDRIKKITKDGVFQHSVLKTLEAIHEPVDQEQVTTLRELRHAINEEAPRSFETLVKAAYATTEEEAQALGFSKVLPDAVKVKIHQSIIDRSPDGTPPKQFDINEKHTLGFADPVAARMAYEVAQKRHQAIDITPEEQPE